jgi:flavorubredoxin
MDARVTEVAPDTYQLSSFVEAPVGFNQYLIAAEEPLLFHTGMRSTFEAVSAGVGSVVPVETLRWVSFGHVEADECGALNQWLAVAPHATPAQSQIGCMVSIEDLADRAPRPLAHGETLDIGGHAMQWFDTPHVPHAWEAGVLYDRTTKTLLCGDLFTRFGEFEATSDDDIVGPAVAAEDMAPGGLSLHPASGRIIRELADLDVTTLALMHGPAFSGDCRAALLALADDFDAQIARLSG